MGGRSALRRPVQTRELEPRDRHCAGAGADQPRIGRCPGGEMTVLLGPGWPGVLLHEAVGHGLEGDFNRKGTSAFSGRIGERVGAPGVTVIDDGSIPGRRGSLSIDDEGTPTQENVLVEDGILRGYMQDRLNARLMGVPATGNGSRLLACCFCTLAANSACSAASRAISDLGEGSSVFSTFLLAALAMTSSSFRAIARCSRPARLRQADQRRIGPTWR
ncbi:MAG: hypothetical protein HC868_17205 [Sphingomonadales bacterium]|nr:hypothetical protein [Sphingomonadales bacterium]